MDKCYPNPGGSVVTNLPENAGDAGLIPRLGRSPGEGKASLKAQSVKNLPAMQETGVRFLGQEDSPGEGNGNPLQYSCLENPMDKGVWWAVVHGVARVAHGLATNPPGADRSMLETDTM